MQTAFVTDIAAKSTRVATDKGFAPVITLKFTGADGVQHGTAVTDAAALHAAARDMMAIAEAAILHAAAPDAHAQPPRKHIMIMRDVRVVEAA
jgi:hypothetical protein